MRPVRRPSIVAQYAGQIAQWLRDDPAISAVDILRRAQAGGYNRGKSALYEYVRRLRTGAQQQLIVVARDREHLGRLFQQAFKGNVTVQVVPDRRVLDRRQRLERYEGERRERDRRTAQATDAQLRTLGWAIVRLPTRRNRPNPASDQANRA